MAVEKKKVIGMVAYHRHSKSRCEMKRLYVKPKYRENKLGKKLVLEILGHAKKTGYKNFFLIIFYFFPKTTCYLGEK